jgi:hypothetical protein
MIGRYLYKRWHLYDRSGKRVLLGMLLLSLDWGCGQRSGNQAQVRIRRVDTGTGQGKGQVQCGTPRSANHGNGQVHTQVPLDTVIENMAIGVYSNGSLTRKDIVLPDGTKVAMHAATSLRILRKFNRGGRELWLDGDALFELKGGDVRGAGGPGNAGRTGMVKPFVIHTGNLWIQVLAAGSRFRVDARKKEAGEEVDLLAGKLKVMKSYRSDTDNEPDTIVAGEMVMINRDIDLMEKEKMDGTDMKGWK